MSNIAKRVAKVCAVAALALGLAACGGAASSASSAASGAASGASDASAKVYRIVSDTSFPPFEYQDNTGAYTGIDVDILAAIAKDQGFQYEIEHLGFNAALQAVQSNQADGVIAGMSITDERKKIFDFSEPYFDSTVCCAAKTGGEVTKLDDLKGKNVAVKVGTQSRDWALSLKDSYGFTVTEFDKSDVMYQDVLAGNSAACFEDTPVMSYAISTGSINLSVIDQVDATSEFATPYGFAVNKGANPELIKMFNDGLAHIKANGTFDQIVQKHTQGLG